MRLVMFHVIFLLFISPCEIRSWLNSSTIKHNGTVGKA